MKRYSVQSRHNIFLKGYRFLSFAKNIGKNISKKLSGKYSQKLLDHAQQSATDAFKTASKRAIQKTAETTDDLIGNKLADAVHLKTLTTRAKSCNGKITKFSKNLQQIIQTQLQMRMIKKYLKRDIYLQEKEKFFLIILILI